MPSGENWTDLENEVIVAAYLGMLTMELRGESFVKSHVNEAVKNQIGRSKGSVEYKFQNVSAVLIEMSHPYVRGYKAAVNFQESLRDAVLRQLPSRSDLREAALVEFTRDIAPRVDFSWNLTDPPTVEFSPHQATLRRAAKIDYVQIDAANRSLGLAGELAVVEMEKQRLMRAGLGELVRDVRHVSQVDGDGAGYDIRSFFASGEEKFIEVKTTRRGPQWPMLVSSNELRFSEEESQRFSLYRVYDFDQARRGLFELPGDLHASCVLRPVTFEALPA